MAFTAISTLIALMAAIASVCRINLLPPEISMRELQTGAAVSHILVDLPENRRGNVTSDEFSTMTRRASLIGHVLASPPVLNRIASRMEIDAGDLTGASQVTEGVPSALTEPDYERRANEILLSHRPYRLDIQAKPTLPIIDVYAQAPTAAKAMKLADTTAAAGNEHLRAIANRDGVPAAERVRLNQLGSAASGQLDPMAPVKIFGLAFLVVFGVAFGILFLIASVARGWIGAGRNSVRGIRLPPPEGQQQPAAEDHGGSWPHTTRVMPWMIAAFITMFWLVPFNVIQLQASLPIDLKLDRLVLPLIIFTWVVGLVVAGRGAVRGKFTAIHAVIAGFAAVAGLSLVLDAAYLNQTLELGLGVKKLALLGAYLSIFFIIASVVRPTEIRAFLNLTLVLAVVCALGLLWEYRFELNVFYSWSQKLLPGLFQFNSAGTGGVDEIGRRLVVGPAEHGLEVVAMLSMALPIAIVRLMHSSRSRERILYGVATCLLIGASLSTYRKSAILAPISACMVLAYFRRRELLRLAPFGLILIMAIPVLSPNALGSVVDQLEPDRLGVSTVSDRVSDYDAIRADILSQPAVGRGYGSYEHTSYRILDNDLLTRLVESGILGLVAFVLIIVTLIAVAAPIIRSRDPARAPQALAIAAGVAPFLVLSALFDIMSFPHAPYILLTLAGLLAVMAADDERPVTVPDPDHKMRGIDELDPRDLEQSPRSIPTPV